MIVRRTLYVKLSLLFFFIYSIGSLHSSRAQIDNWENYSDPGHKFNFLYPRTWIINSHHDNITGTTEVILEHPNSTRAKISVLYNPNDSLLKSKTGKPVLPSRALTNLENEISPDYIFFNSTGQFAHKYSVQTYQSAGDVIDYEKSDGKPGKMLVVFAKVNEKGSSTFTFSESKRLFYKDLSTVSQIMRSIAILQ
jgi:hypothetical protein